ncbi:hypothetical protein ALO67_200066 [Pseudomonas amygdali pv. hibisci]|uniref:TrbB protein n=1 Tax=Pseudomonas amygdali pv. hibisci TaxID=251723 RepID=A0AB34U7M0_PSEA0|nr:hypothetical protein ALO67_200066 [Pseudomonas amygdali pv. hibisci]
MALQVRQRVGAEGADVGHASAVGGHLCDVALCLVPGQQFGLFAADVVGEQVDLHQLLFFIVAHEAYAAGVDEQAALDAASA